MHVILISGIYDTLPSRSIGPYLLRHYLSKRNISCQIIDFCQEYTSEKLVELVSHFVTTDTICIGYSTTFWRDLGQFFWNNDGGMPPNLYTTSKLLHDKFPNIRQILGGPGIRYIGHSIEVFDCAVVGESEDLFPDLVNFWLGKGDEPGFTINNQTNKKYYHTAITNNYDIAYCDFMWVDRDCIIQHEALPLETSRGCIFKCKFCAFPHLGKKKLDYIKPLENVRNHLLNNYEKWGVTHYLMNDDTFNDSEHKVDNFLSMVKTLPFTPSYAAYIRSDLLHRFDGMAEKLYESGLRGAFFGIESLHPMASMTVGKGWMGKYAKEVVPKIVHETWKGDVAVTMGFIVGLPHENSESLKTTLRWINDNNFMVTFMTLTIVNPSNLRSRSLDTVAFTSEFERNSAAYGYKMDEAGEWYNNIWTNKEAERFTTVLNVGRRNKQHSCWAHILLHGFGYTKDEIWNLAKSGVRHSEVSTTPDFLIRKRAFIEEYTRQLLELPSTQ